jgi:hypothetical protein
MSPHESAESVSKLPRVSRRAWLAAGATGLGLALCDRTAGALAGQDKQKKKDAASAADQKDFAARRLAYLKPLVYVRKDIDDWLAGRAFPFCKYDPELGYLHIDRDFKEGLDGAVCRYRYDPSGARHVIACSDQPCRINTYGNSFTSCEQVSDGETWQEVLAAHLGEPVRNFGIGGYSVYQAYLRMKREEQRSPARYIIINIFDDDHYRNLLSWQRLRFGVNRKSTCPPVPYVVCDPDAGTLVERPNPCPSGEALYKLCDLEGVSKVFEGDYVLERNVRLQKAQPDGAAVLPRAIDFDDDDLTRRAVFATTKIVDKIEDFARRNDRKVLYVLSFGADRIQRFVKLGRRFDQLLVDYLDRRKLPYVDLLQAHLADAKNFAVDLDTYLARYYIGHYNPLGNHFCAFALKDQLAKMLDPAPPAFSPPPAIP